MSGPLGLLDDGSILTSTTSHAMTGDHTTFYAWQAGQTSWRQVGPQIRGGIVSVVVTIHGQASIVWYGGSGRINHFAA